ncbi:MAG: hypothetical protein AB1611_11500 [bacterium]
MKKIASILFAVCLLFALSSKVNAYWESGNLIEVIYNEVSGWEIGRDLGAISSMGSAIHVPIAAQPGAWVAFFGYDGVSDADGINYYFATTEDMVPSVKGSAQSSFVSGYNGCVLNNYKLGDVPADGITETLTSLSNSYWAKMDSSTTRGQFAGFNNGYAEGKLGEAALTEADPTMYLYQFKKTGSTTVTLIPGQGTDYRLVINPVNPVPIPGGFLLLASGILGLVGIKRRYSA